MHGQLARQLVFYLGIFGLTSTAAMAVENNPIIFMTVKGQTAQPIGHHEFCQAHATECVVRSESRVRVKLDQKGWNDLVAVNDAVNTSVRPTTDQALFGRPEVWDYPKDSGDCEDFVLLKRRMLMEAGWPAAALLITVVRQRNGDGHAVLTVTTSRGDLVLDNLDPHISLWSETDYQFLKRQSEYDSGAWIAIEDGRTQRAQEVGSLK
jgi:predicted transglutaminase-like cysteine proteinase